MMNVNYNFIEKRQLFRESSRVLTYDEQQKSTRDYVTEFEGTIFGYHQGTEEDHNEKIVTKPKG